jgi:hypothetical protein
MSIDAHLIHTATIQRMMSPNLTPLRTSRQVWTTLLTAQPCRLVFKSQLVSDGVTSERAILTSYLLMLPAETNVKNGDRVTDLVDERGVTEANADGAAAIFAVRAAMPRRARAQRHITLQLERLG